MIQYLINLQRRDEGLGIAEEREQPDEEAASSVDHRHDGRVYAPALAARQLPARRQHQDARCGAWRGDHTRRSAARFRKGVFAEPKTYPAWVRFSGPGPDWPRDIDDVGFVSCAIKLMGVPGPKLLDDEKLTQDFLSICTPTFVTPDTRANAKLQSWILKGRPLFYFTILTIRICSTA